MYETGSPARRRANRACVERALDESTASSARAMSRTRSQPRTEQSKSSASDRGSPDSRSKPPIVAPVSTAFTPGPCFQRSSANAASCSVWCSASNACVSWERSPSMMSLILGRGTDHRIGLTLYKINDSMGRHLSPLTQALPAEHQAEPLPAVAEERLKQGPS